MLTQLLSAVVWVSFIQADGTRIECDTAELIEFTNHVQEVTVTECGGHALVVCYPTDIVLYLPDQRALDISACNNQVFKDGFEQRNILFQ